MSAGFDYRVEAAGRRARLVLLAGAGLVVSAILVASFAVRGQGVADPVADVAAQRRAVQRFGALVVEQRWPEVFGAMTEPPTADAVAFADLMRGLQEEHGRVVAVEVHGIELRRSTSVPMLEVVETVRTDDGSSRPVVSYYVWDEGRWLFAFSAPRG